MESAFPESGGYESSFDHDKDDPLRPEKTKVRDLGLIARKVANEKEKEEEKEEKKSKKSRFERAPKDDAKREKTEKKQEKLVEDEIETAKREVVKEHIKIEVAELDVQIEATEPGTAEHTQAVAAKAFLSQVDKRTESKDEAIDPAIEIEFQKRMNEAQAELVEQGLIDIETPIKLDEEVPNDQETAPETASKDAPKIKKKVAPLLRLVTQSGDAPPGSQHVATATRDSGGLHTQSAPPSPGISNERAATPIHAFEKKPEPTKEERIRRATSLFGPGVLTGYFIKGHVEKKRRGVREKKHEQEKDRLHAAAETTRRHLSEREIELKRAVSGRHRENAPRRPENKVLTEATPVERVRNGSLNPANEVLRHSVLAPAVETERSSIVTPSPAESAPKTEVTEKQIVRVEQLSTPEILHIAETLYISGTSVRELYQTNQIDRRGLEHIVKQGLRGGDIKKAFVKVELGRERQRERAREFRHDDTGLATPISAAATAIHQTSTALAAVHVPDNSLPNQPNRESLQPLTPNPSASTPAPIQGGDTLPQLSSPSSLQSYIGPAVVLAIGISLLIIWLIF